MDVISQCCCYRKEKQGQKKKLKVHYINQDEFKNFALDDLLVKRTVDAKNESFQWSLIHHMLFRAGLSINLLEITYLKKFSSLEKARVS